MQLSSECVFFFSLPVGGLVCVDFAAESNWGDLFGLPVFFFLSRLVCWCFLLSRCLNLPLWLTRLRLVAPGACWGGLVGPFGPFSGEDPL